MTAKTESPSKLGPDERLARKRAAARLRQQRCRARKRQALLEQRRHQSEALTRRNEIAKGPTVQGTGAFRTPFPGNLDKWSVPSMPSPHRIYKCVSFDSQRSLEETMRPQQEVSPTRVDAGKMRIDSTSPKQVADVISIQEEKKEDPLVSQEETAIAAMLSLKSSPTRPKTGSVDIESGPRPTAISNLRFHNNWDKHQYGKARFGLRPRVPEYFRGMQHPRPPTTVPHYNYYHATPRFVRYE